jgi:hypothetical protein
MFYLSSGNNASTIRYSDSIGWEWREQEHVFLQIEILPTTVTSLFLIVLHFKTQSQKKKSILIYKDSMLADEYRQLLVILKINGLNYG